MSLLWTKSVEGDFLCAYPAKVMHRRAVNIKSDASSSYKHRILKNLILRCFRRLIAIKLSEFFPIFFLCKEFAIPDIFGAIDFAIFCVNQGAPLFLESYRLFEKQGTIVPPFSYHTKQVAIITLKNKQQILFNKYNDTYRHEYERRRIARCVSVRPAVHIPENARTSYGRTSKFF